MFHNDIMLLIVCQQLELKEKRYLKIEDTI